MDNSKVIVKAVGDILLARDVLITIQKNGINAVVKQIRNIIGDSDLNFGNLECCLSKRGKAKKTAETSFIGSPDAAKILKASGFKVVSLANNHIHDYGPEAVEDTINTLHELGISGIGIGRNSEEARRGTIVSNSSGIRIGFLAYTSFSNATKKGQKWVVAYLNAKNITEDITRMRRQTDFVLVSWHAGYEMVNVPSPWLRKMARIIAEAGAHCIIGHGPHVLQAIETIDRMPVFYSLGNFIFDMPWAREREQSMIANIILTRTHAINVSYTPVWIGPEYIPVEPTESQKREIVNLINTLNNSLNRSNFGEQYWKKVGDRVFRDQFGMIVRVYKKAGVRGIFSALSKIRGRHFILLIVGLRSKIEKLFPSSRKQDVNII